MLLKFFRNALGAVIVFVSWLTKPKAIQRSPEQQLKVQESLAGLSLYQLFSCPFCVKTRRAMQRLNIELDIKDINRDSAFRQELMQGGGKTQVPCLRIEQDDKVEWLYESNDIIQFLEQKVS